MKAEFLFLFIKATKCHSHCRHCMTHPAESSAVMDSGAILESIDRFSRYARQVGTSLAVQLGDCPLDHADFPMILGRMKEQSNRSQKLWKQAS